jgi:hypothetical protein
MGYVNIVIDSGGGDDKLGTEYYQSNYAAARIGREVTIEVVVDITSRANILELIESAGAAAYGRDLNGTAWFVDRAPPETLYDNVSVGVEPVNLPEMVGFYGVIVDGEDLTTIPGSRRLLSITFFILAHYNEYNSVSDMRSALEVSVP